ncbi:hypothetical protein FBU30_001071, partial [Linnemannia zychae]
MSIESFRATKRPFQFLDIKTAEDIAVDIAQTLTHHSVSLRDLLHTIFTSSHPAVTIKTRYFYRDGGSSEMVRIWTAKSPKDDKAFIEAAMDAVVATSTKEFDQLSELNELRHPANDIDLEKLQHFEL